MSLKSIHFILNRLVIWLNALVNGVSFADNIRDNSIAIPQRANPAARGGNPPMALQISAQGRQSAGSPRAKGSLCSIRQTSCSLDLPGWLLLGAFASAVFTFRRATLSRPMFPSSKTKERNRWKDQSMRSRMSRDIINH